MRGITSKIGLDPDNAIVTLPGSPLPWWVEPGQGKGGAVGSVGGRAQPPVLGP